MKIYKSYEIDRLTRNTYRIRPIGGEWVNMPGKYPKTLKEAKAIIDNQ